MSRLVLPCWLLLTACGETEPCWGLEKGHTYSVDVLAAYGPESEYEWAPPPVQNRPSCGVDLDIGVGTTLEFEVVEYLDLPAASCLKSGARVSGLTSALEGSAGSRPGGPPGDRPAPVYAGGPVTLNGCPGAWGMQLAEVGTGAPFAAPVPGQVPPVVLVRVFVPLPESEECTHIGDPRTLCADEFVVQVRKN
jgi:hypothetical protein